MELDNPKDLHQLLALSGIGYWKVNLVDGTLTVSDSFWEMLGYNPGDLEQTLDNLKKIHHPDDWNPGWEKISLLLKGDIPVYENEIRYLTKNKTWMWCEVKGIVSKYDDKGNPLVFMGYGKDISAIREMKQRIKKLTLLEQDYHAQLKKALADIKSLSGIIPICSSCKNIRNDKGYWKEVESFMEEHSEALFSHGLCDQCAEQLYKDEGWYQKFKESLKKEQFPSEPD